MKRKTLTGGHGYAISALGVVVVGTIALILTASYPATGITLLIAIAVALAGIGQRWHRHLKRQRQRESFEQIEI
jgi:membrane protein implicated in regulation of membrane protease activity